MLDGLADTPEHTQGPTEFRATGGLLAFTLLATISATNTIVDFLGNDTVAVGSVAQIDSEYMQILSVSAVQWTLGSPTAPGQAYRSCEVTRGFLGTTPAAHTATTSITQIAVALVNIPSTAEKAALDAAAAGANAPLNFATATPGGGTAGDIMTTGTSWVVFSGAGACGGKLLLENDSATGTFATWRMRARYGGAAVAQGNGGNDVGDTYCIDASASANHADYGVLRAVNAVAQPNAFNQTTDTSNHVEALYGRIDATGTSVGNRWVCWLDTHATTKAGTSDFMERISHNGTVAIGGVFTIYTGGRLPQLFNFEDVAGFLSTSSSGSLTKTHKIAVSIAGDATQYYIEMGTIA